MNFKKFIARILTKASILVFFVSALFIQNTVGYFQDIEVSQDNIVETGTLDLTLRSGQSNFVPDADSMAPGDSVARDIYVGKTAESLPLKHRVSYQFTGGNQDFCDQLQLKIWYDHYHCDPSLGYAACRDMRLKYNGSLAGLNELDDSDFVIPHPDDWFDQDPSDGTEQWFFYQIIVPSNLDEIYQNNTCQFNFVYLGYQQDSDGSWGFTDQEILSNTIGTTDWACEEGPGWAYAVEDYSQGTRKDGSPVLPERSDPTKALGEADSPQPLINFYSLGVDGDLSLSFERPVMNIAGDDLFVYEVTWDRSSYPEEKALVEISQNGINWYPIGEATNHASGGISGFDLDSVGLSWIQYVRLTDTTDHGPHAGNDDGFDVDAVGASWLSCDEQQQACPVVSGYKYDNEQQPLENWEIAVVATNSALLEELTIDADDSDGETTVSNLEADRKYLVEVEGTWNNGSIRKVDANYFSDDDWVNQDDFDDHEDRGDRQLDVVIDDQDIKWGSYNSDHLYKAVISGTGSTINIRIYDEDHDPNPPSWYSDNSGSLEVRIYDVTDNIVTTNQDGYWQAELCQAVDYQVVEVLPDGWQQISPENPSYYHLSFGQLESLYDFVNEQVVEEQPPESLPIVLNEILPNPEGDDNQSGLDGEWVELYNNGDTDVDVSGWYIKDGSESGNKQTISSSTTYNSQTVLGAEGSGSEWLVLFMSGFVLDNTGDTVTLYTNEDVFVDTYAFSGSANDDDSDSANTPGAPNSTVGEDPGNEGKSYARIPDGTGEWVDPDPTPGGPNRLESEEEIDQKDEMENQAEETEREGEIEQENETEKEIEIEQEAVNEDEDKESEENINNEMEVDEQGVGAEEEVQQGQAESESEEEMPEVSPEEPEELEQEEPSESTPEIEIEEVEEQKDIPSEEGVPPIPEESKETNEEI